MLKTWNSGDREGAIAKAMEIIKNYPGTYTCDNTCMQLGYYLIRQGEYTPAKQVFTDTLSSLEKYGLDNPMAVEAKRSIRNLKIAMNYENPDDMPKDDVINSALGFVEEYPDDLDGHLQLAGSLFEKVQVSIITNTPFDQELWDQMIATLTLISETPGKKTVTHARADLMLLESAFWKRDTDTVIAKYDKMMNSFDRSEFSKELFTASFFTADAHAFNGDYDMVVKVLRPAIDNYDQSGELWSNLDIVERSFSLLITALANTSEKETAYLYLSKLEEVIPGTFTKKSLESQLENNTISILPSNKLVEIDDLKASFEISPWQ